MIYTVCIYIVGWCGGLSGQGCSCAVVSQPATESSWSNILYPDYPPEVNFSIVDQGRIQHSWFLTPKIPQLQSPKIIMTRQIITRERHTTEAKKSSISGKPFGPDHDHQQEGLITENWCPLASTKTHNWILARSRHAQGTTCVIQRNSRQWNHRYSTIYKECSNQLLPCSTGEPS